MSKIKKTPIKYTSRDFDSIRNDLVQYAKRYYPDSWKDFSKSTINSLIIDSVAYVGDVLSYYVDYQANESFLDTSIEFDNIRKHARALGYKYSGTSNSYGVISIFCMIPANSDGTAPDFSYMPTIRQGTTFGSNNGTFTLTEDIRMDDTNNEIVAARFDSTTGQTTHFAVKAMGQIVSGVLLSITSDLSSTSFKRFNKIRIGGSEITEVVSVIDTDGNNFYEVENLAQEVIFRETTNKDATSDGVRSIIKPYIAARRFVLEQDETGTYLQFGFGSESTTVDGLADPAQVAIKMFGHRNISTLSFDPTTLLGTTKLGISPSNTNLTILIKANNKQNVNAGANTVDTILSRKIKFDNVQSLVRSKIQDIIKLEK